MNMIDSKWIYGADNKPFSKVRLFCLPYAGCGSSMYISWKKYFPEEVELCPIQLPGRENRRKEDLCCNLRLLVDEMAEGIASFLDKPFGIFGYSMGGVIAYELALKIKEKYKRSPFVIFMGASTVFMDLDNVSGMKENELKKYLNFIGGAELSELNNPSFQEEFFPVIRNDYRMIENYHFNFTPAPCRICSFASKEDCAVPFQNISLLKFLTDEFSLITMRGSHFFIRDDEREITKTVLMHLRKGAFLDGISI